LRCSYNTNHAWIAAGEAATIDRRPTAETNRTQRTMTHPPHDDDPTRVRIDKWLWAARFYKTRSLAAQAVEGGKVRVNAERVKAAKALRVGDAVALQLGAYDWLVVVAALSDRRGPAEAAQQLYREDPAARAARLAAIEQRRGRFDPEPLAGGRPEKKQRRDLQRLRGY
jgi:ribosome-associated heat shock protein Hsp15